MEFMKIPYTELKHGQKFKFTERQRNLRVFDKSVSLAGVPHAEKVGDEALIIYDDCNQQPVKPGQEVFLKGYTHCTIDSRRGRFKAKVGYSEIVRAWQPIEVLKNGKWIDINKWDDMPGYNIYGCENYRIEEPATEVA